MAKVKKYCPGKLSGQNWRNLPRFYTLHFAICGLHFDVCTLQGRAVLRAEKESMKSAASGNSGGGLVSSPGNDKSCKDHLDRDHEHGDLREDGAEIFLKMAMEDLLAGQADPQAHHLSPQ